GSCITYKPGAGRQVTRVADGGGDGGERGCDDDAYAYSSRWRKPRAQATTTQRQRARASSCVESSTGGTAPEVHSLGRIAHTESSSETALQALGARVFAANARSVD